MINLSLYKKGTQTMKNTITTIAMFILAIGAQAQQTTVKLKNYYFFKHDAQYTTVDALNNNLETSLGGIESKETVLVFDETSMTVNLKTELNGNSGVSKIDRVIVLGPKTVMYLVKDEKTNVVYSYTVFENQPNEMMVLCVWRKGLFEFEGWQGH
jgi:hypothetical protein